MVRRHASESIWVIGPMVSDPPAQCTTPCSRPCQAVTASTARVASSSLVMSAGSKRTEPGPLARLDLVDRGRQLVGVAADDHDGGTGGDQPGGHALAYSAATAGDQVRPVLERKLHVSSLETALKADELKQVLVIEPCARRHDDAPPG